MYQSWQTNQWSGSGNSGYGGDWRQSAGWCDPAPVCPPTVAGEAETCDPDDKEPGDNGWPGTSGWTDTNDWSGTNGSPDINSWSPTGGDGCGCSFDHHGPWHAGGFGQYGPWQHAFGHLGPGNWGLGGYGHSHGWPGHGHGFPLLSEGVMAQFFGLLNNLPEGGLGSLGGLLGGLLPGGLGGLPGLQGLPFLPHIQLDDPGHLAHLFQYLAHSVPPFAPSSHWWKPGYEYGGFGGHHPKPCIEPPELGFKVFRYIPDTGQIIDLNDGIGDPGRGNGDPGHRYPWAQVEHGNALYVGVLNGNPNPLHLLPAALSLFSNDIPFAPTLHSSGPEIWRWTNPASQKVTTGEEGGQATATDLPDGGYWEKVLDADDLGDTLDGQVGIREMFSYNGYIYATTSNSLVPLVLQGSREPATMIRSKSGEPGTWEEVPRGPGTDDDPFDDPTNTSIRTIEEINGLLVIGTEKASSLLGPGAGSPEGWTFDGTTWTRVEGEVEGFAISEILGFRPGDAGAFETIQVDGAQALSIPRENAYFGNWDPEGYNLYTIGQGETDDDPGQNELNAAPAITPTIIDITPTHVRYVGQGPNLPAGAVPDYIIGEPDANGLYDADDFGDVSPFDDLGIIKMFEFDPNPRDEEPGYLYFGTVDYQDGATLMRSQTPDDPTSWELITADGFFSEFGGEAVNTPESGPVPLFNGNFYIWSAAVTQQRRNHDKLQDTADDPTEDSGFEDSTLYIGTFNGLQGSGQVLKSTDGVNFEFVTQDAFGAENIYGFRSIETVGNDVFFGGASPITTLDPSSHPYAVEDPWAFDFV